jgi:hypothetical protein
MDDKGEGMARLTRYFQSTITRSGGKCLKVGDNRFEVSIDGQPTLRITANREAAKEDEQLSLLGLEHPLVKRFLEQDRNLEATSRAWLASSPTHSQIKGILTVWHVLLQDSNQRFIQRVIAVGLDEHGKRCNLIEKLADSVRTLSAGSSSVLCPEKRAELIGVTVPDMLRRDLAHKGLLSDSVTLSWRLLAWVEIA